MVRTTAEGRRELLDTLARTADETGFALASIGAAYEQLDVQRADELEEALFRPLQLAHGRTRRLHQEFAARHGLPAGEFESPSAGLPSIGAKAMIENAMVAVGRADHVLAELQDSLLPVEVGDPELRAGLAELRTLVGELPQRGREVVRLIGR